MRKSIIIATSIVALAAPLTAQDPVMALNPTTMIGFAGTVAADQYARREIGARMTQRRPTQRPAASAASVAKLSFRPNPAVRQQVYARAVAETQKTSPSEAPKLRDALRSGKVARETASYLGRYGMSVTNLADTTALYLAIAWLATRGSDADPSRAQMIGLRNQVAETYFATPALASASDATKQDLSEANIIQAAFAGNVATAAAKDRKFAAMARPQVAKGVMALYGINLLKMSLTPQGLR